jgi:glucosamine--fructose-6-phosphate aminotransferase (isomerizing)
MCGIIGIIRSADAKTKVAEDIIEGLRRLEYRGYDSAGIATVHNGEIHKLRAQGKLSNLERALFDAPLSGLVGIGHTRWATHGAPSERNAHPHSSDKVALVHNGIIENYQELKAELLDLGYVFNSDTDSEVIAMLITRYIDEGTTPEHSTIKAIQRLHGAYAIAVIFKEAPDILIGARKGSPLAVGYGKDAMYLGSDAIGLAPLTSRITYMEEGDFVVLTKDDVRFMDAEGTPVERSIQHSEISSASIGKEGFRHFMQKEIFEQPKALGETITAYIEPGSHQIKLGKGDISFRDVEIINIIACGTSYYAGMVASYLLEKFARISTRVEIASEFRYRSPVLNKKGLAIVISQSGETADTLAAMRLCKESGLKTVAIVNSPESTMANEADSVMRTYAGPEIGVASTKAFTTQLACLSLLAIKAGTDTGAINREEGAKLLRELIEIPGHVAEVLMREGELHFIAQDIMNSKDAIYIGRGSLSAIAYEGALKLKEISYIHAEGFAAGELKHGPIALIDETVPVIAVAPSDGLFEKTASNVQEVVARSGKVVLLSDKEGINKLGDFCYHTFEMPKCPSSFAPIIYAIPVQLLAYHVAVLKGTDVDQPRNLAKSVTVE